MCKVIERFLKNCSVCQQNKHSTQRVPGLLQPVENPSKPFEHVTMDFIVQLPTSVRGYDAIFSIVDRFSRLCRFIPCTTSLSAYDAAQLFFEHWVCRFGIPKKIISDRDTKFTSQFWQELFRLLGTKLALSTAYHPQTDGLTERYNRTIEQTLRCYCSGKQQEWCLLLSQCEFSLNSTYQTAISDTPFQVVYGFIPTVPLDIHTGSVQLPAVQSFVEDRRRIQQQVQDSLSKSQESMKITADRHRRSQDFAIGQKVWLATKHLPLRSLTRKLTALWAGPFVILRQIGPAAYQLDLPSTWNIHNVFHVSQLKQVQGDVYLEQPIEIEGQSEYEIEQIVDSRVVRNSREYLVKWKGYGDWENSWVKEQDMGNAQEILDQFRQSRLTLPGKSRSRRGSGVRT